MSVFPGISFASLSVLSRFFSIYFRGVVPGSIAFNFFLHCKFLPHRQVLLSEFSFRVDLVSYRPVDFDSLTAPCLNRALILAAPSCPSLPGHQETCLFLRRPLSSGSRVSAAALWVRVWMGPELTSRHLCSAQPSPGSVFWGPGSSARPRRSCPHWPLTATCDVCPLLVTLSVWAREVLFVLFLTRCQDVGRDSNSSGLHDPLAFFIPECFLAY